MKVNELLTKEEALKINKEECLVCKVHEIAAEKIPNAIKCPNCGTYNTLHQLLGYDLDYKYSVVGEVNYIEDEMQQNIEKYLVGNCIGCGKYIALISTEIIYNGNHGILYTGGKDYLINDDLEDFSKIKSSVEQYTRRIKDGEALNPDNLLSWMRGDIESIIATYLYKNGFKK
jgi:predicted RNA-binding Zn-ribbon protein involved in translation (DUF1610 family)